MNRKIIIFIFLKILEIEQESCTKSDQLRSVKFEKEQIETQLTKMLQQQRESRAEIDVMTDALSKLEIAQSNWERAKKSMEIEKSTLKIKAEQSEDKLNEMNVKLINFENLERRLAMAENTLINKTETAANIEMDNRMLKQQVKKFKKKNLSGIYILE